jgi:hypothetical protein
LPGKVVAHLACSGSVGVAHQSWANRQLRISVSYGVSLYWIWETRGPVSVSSGMRQAVEVASVDRVARDELGVIRGGLRWGSDLIFFSYSGGEA